MLPVWSTRGNSHDTLDIFRHLWTSLNIFGFFWTGGKVTLVALHCCPKTLNGDWESAGTRSKHFLLKLHCSWKPMPPKHNRILPLFLDRISRRNFCFYCTQFTWGFESVYKKVRSFWCNRKHDFAGTLWHAPPDLYFLGPDMLNLWPVFSST